MYPCYHYSSYLHGKSSYMAELRHIDSEAEDRYSWKCAFCKNLRDQLLTHTYSATAMVNEHHARDDETDTELHD